MALNLILDAWIPVLDRQGQKRVIAPWQMTDPDIIRPNWPRADLNMACLELLIGLVFLADPPEDTDDWEDRQQPDPDRLKQRLAAFADAFNLTGPGPLFLQDFHDLDKDHQPPDILFMDSAGGGSKNSDLMVKRDRYRALDPALAAMALYTLQDFAPSGGAGHRTSMRGGGPLVTLINPHTSLWDLVWANVPNGQAGNLNDLPWMRPTKVSDKGQEVHPPADMPFNVEAFFGMPRRMRLVAEDGYIIKVKAQNYGTNYTIWQHPLTPYYRVKAGEIALPKHPRAGRFGYHHWIGVLMKKTRGEDTLSEPALCLREWGGRRGRLWKKGNVSVLVAGWSMDNMKPVDFILSEQPFVNFPEDREVMLAGMIEAAGAAQRGLREALKVVLAAGETVDGEAEVFYRETESVFLKRFDALKGDLPVDGVAKNWLGDLRDQAMKQFDRLAVPGLATRDLGMIAKILAARGRLGAAFYGYGTYGKDIFNSLDMELPAKKSSAKKGKAA